MIRALLVLMALTVTAGCVNVFVFREPATLNVQGNLANRSTAASAATNVTSSVSGGAEATVPLTGAMP